MEVLQALGLNSTIGIQFIVFFVAYIFLSNLLFKPYLAAFVKRKEQTEGQETLAESLDLTTQDLHLKVDALQRELALKIQAIFNEAKKIGAKEAKLLSLARFWLIIKIGMRETATPITMIPKAQA